MKPRTTVLDRFWTLAAQSYIGHIESLLMRNVHSDRAAKALQLLSALAQEIDILENKS